MIICRLKSLVAKIEEEQTVRISMQELADACGSTRQTLSKLANNQETRMTVQQFDQILKKLNSYGYEFQVSDLFQHR